MKIHYMNCATMFPKLAKWFAPHLATVPSICLLLETGTTCILIDTGFGTRDMADPLRLGPANRLLNARPDIKDTAVYQVEQLGIAPERVTHVICTHLDSDHAGGLSDFSHARVHVLKPEYDAVFSPENSGEKHRYRRCQVEHGPAWVLHDENELSPDPWFGMECIRNISGLPSQIVLVPLPGHTRGHCGVALETEKGWVFHCGDAFYVKHEVTGKTPLGVAFFRAVAHTYRLQAAKQVERLKALVAEAKDRVTLIGSHDPVSYKQFIKKPLQ
ncbi:MBL fold metallo-hydrolase [Desulfosudis oleivorans]|uniref:Beta-lactamase domain protein n=1 Tax=Desulfosudis oleivorans (strain DSM 6200 / JCM 39069 / Hxd3) TaxID=96561 RepID=A8ZZB9_DESOH|nr:MBL fold metallo-hydrolase [Desulfosudis oleivorans]ABW67272.1 beta-lactamase domain protein [Desulfosudis oleivorans Hxd3]